MINWSERIESTDLLGPGKRAVLWVHGCCFSCEGCIARNFREGDFFVSEPESIAEWFLQTDADGLTISGGEPMLQAGELAKMVRYIRKTRDVGVIVYSGFTMEDIKVMSETDDAIQQLLDETDILIDGQYIEEEDHNEPFRGSSNQRILPLTRRYEDVLEQYYFHTEGRKVELRINNEKTLMVGVPGKEQAEIWKRIIGFGENNGN